MAGSCPPARYDTSHSRLSINDNLFWPDYLNVTIPARCVHFSTLGSRVTELRPPAACKPTACVPTYLLYRLGYLARGGVERSIRSSRRSQAPQFLIISTRPCSAALSPGSLLSSLSSCCNTVHSGARVRVLAVLLCVARADLKVYKSIPILLLTLTTFWSEPLLVWSRESFDLRGRRQTRAGI